MRRGVTAAVIGIGVVVLLVTAAAGATGDRGQGKADRVLREAIPGSTGRLVQGPGGEPQGRIAIALPDDVASASQGGGPSMSYADSGWRATIAAAAIAEGVPSLLDFTVTDRVGRRPTEAANFWTGVLRLQAGDSASGLLRKLNTISVDEARRQADENLAVLEAGLPARAITGKEVSVLPLDASANRFAVEIELQVASLPDIYDRLGDVTNGLATGFVGSLDATVEGLAIRVADAEGFEVGSWTAARVGSGTLHIDPRLPAVTTLDVSLPFVSLTGGPQPTSSAQGHTAGAGVPKLIAAFGLESTRVVAGFVGCGNSSCPGGGEVEPSGFLEIGPRRFLRFDTARAARTVRVIVARRMRSDDATVRVVAFGDATTRSSGHRLWRFKLPPDVSGAHRVQVDVDYVHGPSASFNVRVRPRSAASG